MANPEHQPELDGFDRLTVRLYRLGLGLSSLSLGAFVCLSALRMFEVFPPYWLRLVGLCAVVASVALSAACVHLYDKKFRWLIAGVSPLGLAILALGLALPAEWTIALILQSAGVGFTLVSLSALAVKEWFCFRIPGLRISPIFLGAGVFAVLADSPLAIVLCWGPAAVVVGWLAVRKATMPLGHDVGDRSYYQV
ncbi:MAG: DUF2301 domain-containing membrane protein [Myxococcota bacterium]